MRLNRFIASSGVTSRRKADELILQGKVKVNSKLVTELGVQVYPYRDRITVDGKTISLRERNLYLVLNKPKDTITTVKDEIGRTTVLDYVKTHERIYPVGRLDRNTTGVILLTNDGELTARLTHPSYEVEREYHVTLDKPVTLKDAEKIAKGGVDIGRGNITSAIFVAVSKKDGRDVVVVIKEGKYREVRRLFEAFGYDVKKLDRTMFASITHTGMKRGDVRTLSPSEVRKIKRLVGIEDSFR
jgi:23S rRNA pseudouridine2605 synthase